MKYLVKFEGALVGTRNSGRTYTHAVIAVHTNGKVGVCTFSGRLDLAQKEQAVRYARGYDENGTRFLVVPVEVDAVAQAAKKPKTHALVSTNPNYVSATTGRRMVMRSYTSEKLALKALAKCSDGYAVEAL